MTYDWYNIINLVEFEALSLVSKEVEVIFEGVGLKTLLVVKGNYVSVVFDDTLLAVNMNAKNPFEFDSKAVYLDANNDIWVGIANED